MVFPEDKSLQNNKNQERKNTDKTWWQPGLVLFSRLSGWIVGPVIVGLIIGNWLDNKYNKSPWLTLVSVGAAFLISMVGIVSEAIKIMTSMENDKNPVDKIKK
jgi:F0F1-type ATP synthase assembly protein I